MSHALHRDKTLQGRDKNGVVELRNKDASGLPDGTLVAVTPVSEGAADAAAASRVSNEQKEALLRLIGVWKTNQPPSDEEVKEIVEQERIKKYG